MRVDSPAILRLDDQCAEDGRNAYLRQMRRVPGVVIVVATAFGDELGGLTATAWGSLCAEPPMIFVCVNRNARAHELIRKADAFSLNLLSDANAELAAVFSGQRGVRGADRFVSSE